MAEIDVIETARKALRSSHAFDPLPDAEIDRLAKFARLETYETPTLLVRGGEPSDALRYVVSGQIVARASSAEGYEAELVPTHAGQFAAWLGTFTDRTMVQDYWSSPKATLLAFPNARVREAADRFPEVYRVVLGEVGERFQLTLKWIWNTSLSEGPRRLAQQLSLYVSSAPETEDIEISASQENLARMLGWSRQTMNRQLRVLEEEGLIEKSYRQLRIPDRERLAAYGREKDEIR